MAKFEFILPSFFPLVVALLFLSMVTGAYSLPHPRTPVSGPRTREETDSELTPITKSDRDSSSGSTTKSRPTDSTLPDTASTATDSTLPAPISVTNYRLFTQLTRDIVTSSFEASQAAGYLERYLVVYVGVDTTPPVHVCSCFIEERDPEDYQDGHIDIVQQIIEDYSSTEGYISYTEWITEDGSFPMADQGYLYSDTLGTLQQRLQELRDSLGQLVEMVGGIRPTGEQGGGDNQSGMEPETTAYPDCCHDTSFPRQYQTFLDLGSLFTRYVRQDINYLRNEVKQ